MILLRIGLLGLLALMAAACNTPSGQREPLHSVADGPYRLDAGDKVRVIVFGQDALSGEFSLSDRGTISIPLLDAILASGATTAELEDQIVTQLADGLLVNPDVSVEIVEYRPIYVLGEVQSPGQYAYRPGMSVITAVAVGGGFTVRADQEDFSVTRTVADTAGEYAAGRDALLLPGDVVLVHERYF